MPLARLDGSYHEKRWRALQLLQAKCLLRRNTNARLTGIDIRAEVEMTEPEWPRAQYLHGVQMFANLIFHRLRNAQQAVATARDGFHPLTEQIVSTRRKTVHTPERQLIVYNKTYLHTALSHQFKLDSIGRDLFRREVKPQKYVTWIRINRLVGRHRLLQAEKVGGKGARVSVSLAWLCIHRLDAETRRWQSKKHAKHATHDTLDTTSCVLADQLGKVDQQLAHAHDRGLVLGYPAGKLFQVFSAGLALNTGYAVGQLRQSTAGIAQRDIFDGVSIERRNSPWIKLPPAIISATKAKLPAHRRIAGHLLQRCHQIAGHESIGNQDYRVRRQLRHRAMRVDDRRKTVSKAIKYGAGRLSTRRAAKLHRDVGCSKVSTVGFQVRPARDTNPFLRMVLCNYPFQFRTVFWIMRCAHERQVAARITTQRGAKPGIQDFEVALERA